MLKSFKSKGLKSHAETGNPSKPGVPNHDRVRQILLALDAATRPADMDIPGLRFHGLTGNMKGRFSVRVTGNYRITFAFAGEDPIDVDLEDYHGR